MKQYVRQIIPFFIGILIIIGIYIVDVVFYRVPGFIKVFRIEREAAAVVSLLLTFPLLKKIYFDKITLVKEKFLTFLIAALFLLIFIILPHMLIRKYILLWDNNPMLAEYPTVWNAYSVICAVLFCLSLLLYIQIIKTLVFKQENIFFKILYRVIFVAIALVAILFNLIEDRYLYQPVLDGYLGLFDNYKLGIYLFLAISALFAIGSSWLEDLNKQDKVICFVSSFLTLLALSYLFWSKYIVAVYAFSTTVKGFVLVGFLFVLAFLSVTTIKILFHLPTADKVDRVSRELNFLSDIEAMVKQKPCKQKIIDTVIGLSRRVTEANGCWLELRDKDNNFKIKHYLEIDEELVDSIGSFTVDNIKKNLIDNRKFLLIENIRDNEFTRDFKYLDIPWKSLLAIPVIIEDEVLAVFYLVKNKFKGFSRKDEKTLRRFMVHLEPFITKQINETMNGIQPEYLHFRQNNYSIDVIGSAKMQYLTISGGKYFDYCIVGVAEEVNSNDLFELKGSLKILMKMNNNISDIANSIDHLLDTSTKHYEYIFIFLNTKSNQIAIINSGNWFFGGPGDDNKLINSTCPITGHTLENWRILQKVQDRPIDLSRFQKYISEQGRIPEKEFYNNFYLWFGEDIIREDLILIQRTSV